MSRLAKCPNCKAEIVIEDYVEEGDMVFCEECGIGLTVVSLKPLRLKVEEEDWDNISYEDE